MTQISSDDVTVGRNRSVQAYSDSKYYRCWNCGFITHSQRDSFSKEGSRRGDGLVLPSTELASDIALDDTTVTVDSTSDFPESGSFYVYPAPSSSVNIAPVNRIDYTGIGATTFTGCTKITIVHSTDDIVRGESTRKSGCPFCGTLLLYRRD